MENDGDEPSEGPTMTRHDDHHDTAKNALARWLEAEAMASDGAAEEALGALFATALPRPAVPPGLHARLATAADEAAERRARARATVFGLPRRLVERVAALLLLAVGLTGAVVQTVYQEAGGAALSRLTPGQVLSAAAEGLFTVVQVVLDAAEAAVGLVEAGLRLSGAAATIAGTLPVSIALAVGMVIATAVFFLLHDLLADERGWSYAELD